MTRKPVAAQYLQPAVCMDSSTMEFISPRGRGSNIRCSRGSSCSAAWERGCGRDLAVAAILGLSLQISDAGRGAQLIQLMVASILPHLLADPAIGIVNPSEHDGVRRAGLRAGRRHLTIL